MTLSIKCGDGNNWERCAGPTKGQAGARDISLTLSLQQLPTTIVSGRYYARLHWWWHESLCQALSVPGCCERQRPKRSHTAATSRRARSSSVRHPTNKNCWDEGEYETLNEKESDSIGQLEVLSLLRGMVVVQINPVTTRQDKRRRRRRLCCCWRPISRGVDRSADLTATTRECFRDPSSAAKSKYV